VSKNACAEPKSLQPYTETGKLDYDFPSHKPLVSARLLGSISEKKKKKKKQKKKTKKENYLASVLRVFLHCLFCGAVGWCEVAIHNFASQCEPV